MCLDFDRRLRRQTCTAIKFVMLSNGDVYRTNQRGSRRQSQGFGPMRSMNDANTSARALHLERTVLTSGVEHRLRRAGRATRFAPIFIDV